MKKEIIKIVDALVNSGFIDTEADIVLIDSRARYDIDVKGRSGRISRRSGCDGDAYYSFELKDGEVVINA